MQPGFSFPLTSKPVRAGKSSDLRLLDFETFGGFGKGVRDLLRQAANQLSNKLSHAHLDV